MTFNGSTLLTLFVSISSPSEMCSLDQLDNLIFQLYTLSFFLSPTLLPLLCRVASQFVFYKPRELDPKLSLRVWFLLLFVSNVPSFWFHIRDGATESRAVILDFVGLGEFPCSHPPSRSRPHRISAIQATPHIARYPHPQSADAPHYHLIRGVATRVFPIW